MMRVRILYLQALARLAGTGEESLELAPGATVGDAVDAIVVGRPQLAAARRSLLHAVNEEWSPAGAELRDGDTLALMPPVSGG